MPKKKKKKVVVYNYPDKDVKMIKMTITIDKNSITTLWQK